MNPELIRNLRLELNWVRVALPLAVTGFIYLLMHDDEGGWVGAGVILCLYGLWGVRAQSEAVAGEISDRTWDDQRLSGLSAWSLVWGKFIGAAAPAWIGMLVSLLGAMAIWPSAKRDGVFPTIIVGVIAAMAIALFASCVAPRLTLASSRRATTGAFALALLGAAAALFYPLIYVSFGSGDQLVWFGLSMTAERFYFWTMLGVAVFALWGAERCVRIELRLACRPLVWPAFLLFVAGMTAGFATDVAGALLRGGLATLGVGYWALALAPKDPIAVGRWWSDAQAGRWRDDPPIWITAGIAALASAAVAEVGLWLGPLEPTDWPTPTLLASFLFRDAAIVHICALRLRRGHAMGLFAVGALYLFATLLPAELAVAVTPFKYLPEQHSLVAEAIAGLIAAAMVVAAARFWRRSIAGDR